MAAKYWSANVTKYSNALDLERSVFTLRSPRRIAESLKRSAEHSKRRKARTAYQSAMSMLNFYINRAGKNLPAARVRELDPGPVKVAIPFTRAADDGTCNVGRIVVPTRTGGIQVSVASLLPDGTEVLVTPRGANADRFPERRAPVRTTLRAEIVGLPEGDYDVALGPRGHVNFFGLHGTRVRVVGGEVTEVAISK